MLSARELEFVLYEHPAVWDVAVTKQADGQMVAYVQPRTGQKLDADELARFCRVKLGESRVCAQIYVTDKLPKSKTGKISHSDLNALLPNLVCSC